MEGCGRSACASHATHGFDIILAALTLSAAIATSAAARRAPAAPAADSLKVLAAASLTDVLRDLGGSCCDSSGALPPRFNFAGSQLICKRIEGGEKAEAVLMADSICIQSLWRAGKVGPPRLFAHNRLAIIAPARDSSLISYVDLTRPGLRIASAEASSPLGRYTEMLLIRIQGMRRKSGGIVGSIRTNLSGRETSSRAVLDRVMRGEADAGIVYATDLEAAGSKVRTLLLPESMSPQVQYFIAPVASSPHREQAEAFVNYVTGETGQLILHRHGFLP